jgi:hypothetical protein
MPDDLMGKTFQLSMVTTTVQLCKIEIVSKALFRGTASLRRPPESICSGSFCRCRLL